MAIEDIFQIPCNAPLIAQKIEFVEARGVVIVTNASGIVESVTLPSGGYWSAMYISEQIAITEEPKDTANGSVYEFKISAIIPKIDAARYNLNDYERRRWIVRYKDANGVIRIIGTALNPARFTYNNIVDNDNNAYNIKFIAISDAKQPFTTLAVTATGPTFIKGIFQTADTDMPVLTIDEDNAGTYSSITSDGSSGAITINKNGGGYASFSNPLVLEIGDTIIVKRATSGALGYYKIIGTYV